MEFQIRELADGTAVLLTSDYQYLFTFRSVEAARKACDDWYEAQRSVLDPSGPDSIDDASCSVCC